LGIPQQLKKQCLHRAGAPIAQQSTQLHEPRTLYELGSEQVAAILRQSEYLGANDGRHGGDQQIAIAIAWQ
jgi:hypothetical protein